MLGRFWQAQLYNQVVSAAGAALRLRSRWRCCCWLAYCLGPNLGLSGHVDAVVQRVLPLAFGRPPLLHGVVAGSVG
jgi:hypothetical protein